MIHAAQKLRMAAFLVIVLLVTPRALAGAETPVAFEQGGWSLSFDGSNGALLRIGFDRRELAAGTAQNSPVTFGVGPADSTVWLENMGFPSKLAKVSRPAPDTIELTITAGPYELVERYRVFAEPPRLDRSLRLTNRGREAVKLRGVAFRTAGFKTSPDGFYCFPGQWPPRTHRFAEMQAGRKSYGGGSSIAPALAQLGPDRSLLWASYTDDRPGIEVVEGASRFEVRQSASAAGFLRPDVPQEFGFVSVQVCRGDERAALRQFWTWMDAVGLKVPADRPAWVADAVLYSFHPGGTIGSGFKDVGGFGPATERLLPTLPSLGINAVWVMPIEYESPYWPIDYYRFMEGLGTAEQYRTLVRRGHELGFHVLQDLVPHGGAPRAVHNRKSPEFMLRREDGSTFDYWLNDFAWPAWQAYIADVARHYTTTSGIDGFRVDACYGSKAPNWNPDIPYARASLAQLQGGLGMLRGIRQVVREVNPASGAILAEVESARHQAVSDFVYDFGFCYTLCPQWNRMDAAEFVTNLQEYLEEQHHVEPRGAVRLRHVESHDALRSQLQYGVRGMRALYALSAWIDGVPLIYHGQEVGHRFELARINALRRSRPELSHGEASYRAVSCDTPGVFTCLRTLGDRRSVIAINFNREAVRPTLQWPGGHATIELRPLDYVVLPREEEDRTGPAPEPVTARSTTVTLDDVVPFEGAREWFVDTLEGRLRDDFVGPREDGRTGRGGIYWRPQGTGSLWQNAMVPLHPVVPRVGFQRADGSWCVVRFEGPVREPIRLVERHDGKPGLALAGTRGLHARIEDTSGLPPEPDVTAPSDLGSVTIRCVGSQYIVANAHFEAVIRRQGGVIRELRKGKTVLVRDQDFYGDQELFAIGDGKRVNAASDVESGVQIWKGPDGLHLRFDGQLRGPGRFDLLRPPVWYRNEYVFSVAPRFTQEWAFLAEKGFRDRRAFLTAWFDVVAADQYRFLRGDQVVSAGDVVQSNDRVGPTRGRAIPDTVRFFRAGTPVLSWTGLRGPDGTEPNLFLQRQRLFATLLDGPPATMDEGRWYTFRADWDVDAK
jgi:hypothetical protein